MHAPAAHMVVVSDLLNVLVSKFFISMVSNRRANENIPALIYIVVSKSCSLMTFQLYEFIAVLASCV